MTAGEQLTAGQVGERLGVKVGMVRRYALALETVTGISLQVDPVRGRLYPPSAVELLEATRAHLLTHPGLSVEAAMRGVNGEGESQTAPVRVPGMLTSRDDLAELLADALAPALAPILAELAEVRGEVERSKLQVLRTVAPDLVMTVARTVATELREELAHEVALTLRHEVLGELAQTVARTVRDEVRAELRGEVLAEVTALRDQVSRLEVSAHAALTPKARPTGLRGLLARLLGT